MTNKRKIDAGNLMLSVANSSRIIIDHRYIITHLHTEYKRTPKESPREFSMFLNVFDISTILYSYAEQKVTVTTSDIESTELPGTGVSVKVHTSQYGDPILGLAADKSISIRREHVELLTDNNVFDKLRVLLKHRKKFGAAPNPKNFKQQEVSSR